MEELDLKELINIFWRKRSIIVVIVFISMIAGFIYSYFMVDVKYESYTTLVLKQISSNDSKSGNENMNEDVSITQTDMTLNSKLVSTYSELIKSKTVLRQVLSNLSITDTNETELRKEIDVKQVTDTELIQITVKNKDSEKAADIANEIANVFSKKVGEIYNISNIFVVDKAEPAGIPNNINHIKDLCIFFVLGLVISVVYILILNMFDNTIKTEQDIETISGLLVLASIPDCDFNKKGGKE